jgi:hypothetical protein
LGLFQKPGVGGEAETKAQMVLGKLLSVTDQISDALEMFHDYERDLVEEEEMKIVSERSRKETRHDRSVRFSSFHKSAPCLSKTNLSLVLFLAR